MKLFGGVECFCCVELEYFHDPAQMCQNLQNLWKIFFFQAGQQNFPEERLFAPLVSVKRAWKKMWT